MLTLMKTKLSSLLVLTALFLASCTPNNPQPNPTSSNNSVTASWQGTIDGNSYNYTGTYVNLNSTSNYMNNPGKSEGTYHTVNLAKGVIPGNNGDDIVIAISFPTNVSVVGTHILNQNSNNGYQVVVGKNIGNGVTGFTGSSFYFNSNVTLNITEFPSNIGGLIKGNFSGVFGTSSTNPNGSTKAASITFEAIRKL